jgi:hypothetical protein
VGGSVLKDYFCHSQGTKSVSSKCKESSQPPLQSPPAARRSGELSGEESLLSGWLAGWLAGSPSSSPGRRSRSSWASAGLRRQEARGSPVGRGTPSSRRSPSLPSPLSSSAVRKRVVPGQSCLLMFGPLDKYADIGGNLDSPVS